MANYCIQDGIEKYLNIDFTNNPDPTVTKWIAAASAKIDKHCRRDFDNHTDDVEKHPGKGQWGDLHFQRHSSITLKNFPVISVSQVKDNGTVLVDGTNYEVILDEARIQLIPDSRYFYKKVNGVEITYTWGYASVPTEINDACIWLVVAELEKMLKFSEAGVAASVSIEGESVNFPEKPLNPEEILAQLQPYVRWGH